MRNGEFVARKGIPADVRETYARLYKVSWEERLRPKLTPEWRARPAATWVALGKAGKRASVTREFPKGVQQSLSGFPWDSSWRPSLRLGRTFRPH